MRVLIICTRYEIGLVSSRVIADTIHAPFMTFKSKMRMGRSDAPDFDCTIQRCRSKSTRVFGIKFHLHHIMRVAFKRMHEFPSFLPIPHLDGHVVRAADKVRRDRMDGNPAEVIGVSLEGLDLVHRVVVVHTNRRILNSQRVMGNPVHQSHTRSTASWVQTWLHESGSSRS